MEINLKDEIIRLGPWHLNVQVTPELSTSVFQEAEPGTYPESMGKVAFVDPYASFIKQMKQVYPEGLEGKRFLDCACNCGGYSFWAKELGAQECFGFDVRQHWIDQAHFLMKNRSYPNDNMRFEVRDLYDLPHLNLEPFDITMFKGIFYHLPDPVSGLKIAADLTKELLYLDTATFNDYPEDALVCAFESTEDLMSGVHHLSWFPAGPKVLKDILRWAGFQEFCLLYWRKKRRGKPAKKGRLALMASRQEGLLRNVLASEMEEDS
jgi:tRNA (mo5U34)-methyltransferase